MEKAVDDYLDFCAEIGKKPEISCSGTFNVRISSELHYECVKQAYHRNITLNSYVALAVGYKHEVIKRQPGFLIN